MAWFSNLPKAVRMAVTLLLLAAVSYAGYIGGATASLSLFYLAPITLSAWYVGRAAGRRRVRCSPARYRAGGS